MLIKVIREESTKDFEKKVNKFLSKNEHILSIKYDIDADCDFTAIIHYYDTHEMLLSDYNRLKTLHSKMGKKFKTK